jgi:purine-nucleoside/S-methyl-5'-thioadenosine phosphorylase / adenosine deaminase
MTTVPLIRSPLFTQFPNIDAGMSTVQGALSTAPLGFNLGFNIGDDDEVVQGNLNRFLAAFKLGPDRLASMNQVHGTTIQEVNEAGVYPDTDVLVTREPMLGLAVRTADCVPLLLYAPGENIVAAVHAGWRGTVEHIAAQTVEFLVERFSIEPDELSAYIGPSAGIDHYEVGEDVAARFSPSVVINPENANPRVDLKKANTEDLISAGVKETNIDVSDYCTIENPMLFHSHRRDGAGAGRMLALIMLREEH